MDPNISVKKQKSEQSVHKCQNNKTTSEIKLLAKQEARLTEETEFSGKEKI